ncbi:MAG: hypothetical protein OJF49_003142 [Ktedonobacterales bacterium]|jgi:hypothetical protein|nr:MAG: hypothetical protein OJF49_003142 [Ktedonobacterales bacterium]
MDDFEIERTRLRPERDGASPEASGVTLAPDPHRPRDDSPLAPHRRNTRTRLLGTLGAACAVLVALVLLASTVPQARDTFRGLISGPTATPTATLGLGVPIVFFEHLVPWGTLTVNGKPVVALDLANPSYSSDGSGSFSQILARGKNTIAYDAPPWPPVRCVLLVPIVAGKDTCTLAQPTDQQLPRMVGASRLVDLGATIDTLPPDALASLKSAAAHLFNQSSAPVTVQPGEQYLTADGTTATANQPLLATLYRKVWDGQGQDPWFHCGSICPVNGGSQALSDVWQLEAVIAKGYRYTTTAGAVVLADGALLPPKVTENGSADEDAFTATWNNGWQVASGKVDKSPLSCSAEMYWLGYYTGAPGPQETGQWAAANPADGCVVRMQLIDTANQTPGSPMYLLYRFGLLFNVNQAAASYYSYLPFANPYAEALAQQIIARYA